MEVGELRGRLVSMETRLTRHETETAGKLSVMDGKLDKILETQAERAGISSGRLGVITFVISIAGGAAAWITGILKLGGHG
jgi:hypothetical protein